MGNYIEGSMTNAEAVVRLISIKRNYPLSLNAAQAVNLAIASIQENARLDATLERLTSDEAVEAACLSMDPNNVAGIWNDISDALTAALEVALAQSPETSGKGGEHE